MTAPFLPLQSLDSLWFQVTGTLCNLTCTHCFISCSPRNHAFGFLTLETVKTYLEESRRYGVKEYYFTGGEPFLHQDMVEILAVTLEYGPATVLTNGMLLKSEQVKRLARYDYDLIVIGAGTAGLVTSAITRRIRSMTSAKSKEGSVGWSPSSCARRIRASNFADSIRALLGTQPV